MTAAPMPIKSASGRLPLFSSKSVCGPRGRDAEGPSDYIRIASSSEVIGLFLAHGTTPQRGAVLLQGNRDAGPQPLRDSVIPQSGSLCEMLSGRACNAPPRSCRSRHSPRS